MTPVSVATKTRERIFFFLLRINSLKRETAFSSCFFDFAADSANKSCCCERDGVLSDKYSENSSRNLLERGWSCSEYFSFLRIS